MSDIERWDPFGDFRKELDRLFESHFSRWWPEESVSERALWTPRVNIEETPEEYRITAELPGMEKKDIKVSITERGITITGERKREDLQENSTLHRTEIFYGKFARSISFPDEIDPSKAKALYKNGVLRVSLPKAESAKPREIDVKVE